MMALKASVCGEVWEVSSGRLDDGRRAVGRQGGDYRHIS